MQRRHTKTILIACKLAFEGKTNDEIAAELGTHASAITRWRKTPIWTEFERELISAHKKSLIQSHVAEPVTEG